MTDRQRLEERLKQSDSHFGRFLAVKDGQIGRGFSPARYKRITIPTKEQDELAKFGALRVLAAFSEKLYYTQALIAGAILSGKYDKIGIVTPSQYGKSWLLGMVAILMAYEGARVNVAGATTDKTEIIMRYCQAAAGHANQEIKRALTSEAIKKVDRLDASLSKARLSFPGKGQIQGITLGDTFSDLSHNKAVGQGGAYIIDEAALCSEAALAETGRREFSKIDGTKEPLVMISNPHQAGYFYDFITQDKMRDGECVIWMDALTACQEGRWTKEQVLSSENAERQDTLQRYLLCELPTLGSGMFGEPKVEDRDNPYGVYVMGVDAAYRGKDNIEVSIARIDPDGVYFHDVYTIRKGDWIDGVTSRDIIEEVGRIYRRFDCALCCVDIGFGVWLVEGLLQNGVNATGINFGAGATKERVKEKHYSAVNAANMRVEMHLDLQDMIEHQSCVFSENAYERVREVLPMVISMRKASGKVAVIPKQEIKAKIGHSPDAFDAVLLSLHAAVLYSQDNVFYITE